MIERHENYAIIDERYIVSAEGEIFFISNKGIVKRKPRVHSNGYLRATIFEKDFYIHRLVAMCFLDNPFNYPEVNHKDGNKQNNSVGNLEWCTRAQNNKHAFETGLRDYSELSDIAKKPRLKRRRFSESDIKEIRLMIADGKSDTEIAEHMNCSRGLIHQIKTHKTYKEVC